MAGKNESCRFCIRFVIVLCLFLVPSCGYETVDEISLKKLSELPGEHPIVVINFWATWFPPCVGEIPYFNRLQKERPDVHIYAISIDDPALGREVFKFVETNRIAYPVFMRERMNQEQKQEEWYTIADAIPITYIFKNGKLHNSIFGAVENRNELTEVIDGASQEEQLAGSEEAEWDEGYEGDYPQEEE